MTVKHIEGGMADVRFSTDELVILNNALNEICNEIDVPEFGTRIGADVSRARTLLDELGNVLDDPRLSL